MKIGTRSILFGAHQFLVHPWFVAAAWWKLFGFPCDPRLWVAFFVHDLGYWGKPNMDGPEGEAHVELGAAIMHRLFDRHECSRCRGVGRVLEYIGPFSGSVYGPCDCVRWRNFSLYHSRFYAKRDGERPSRLCMADKLAMALEPWWLYLPRVVLSGEIKEYMAMCQTGKNKSMGLPTQSARQWHTALVAYMLRYVNEHRDGREDTWTPQARQAVNEAGVWQ